jgi:hypothetical protein
VVSTEKERVGALGCEDFQESVAKHSAKDHRLRPRSTRNILFFLVTPLFTFMWATYLESCVFAEAETVRDGSYGMATIRITRHVLVDTLESNLQSRATVRQHLGQMRGQTVVGSGFDGESDTLRAGVLGRSYRLVHIRTRMSLRHSEYIELISMSMYIYMIIKKIIKEVKTKMLLLLPLS